MQNNRHNKSIDKKISRILEHKESGKSDVEAYQAIRNEDQYKNKVLLVIIIVIVFIIYLSSRHWVALFKRGGDVAFVSLY